MSPPKTPAVAAVTSTWNGCGSNCRAKSMMCDSVTVMPGDRNSSPALKSSRCTLAVAAGRGRLRRDVHLGAGARGGDPCLPRLALLLREDFLRHLVLLGGEAARLGRRAVEHLHHVVALLRLHG